MEFYWLGRSHFKAEDNSLFSRDPWNNTTAHKRIWDTFYLGEVLTNEKFHRNDQKYRSQCVKHNMKTHFKGRVSGFWMTSFLLTAEQTYFCSDVISLKKQHTQTDNWFTTRTSTLAVSTATISKLRPPQRLTAKGIQNIHEQNCCFLPREVTARSVRCQTRGTAAWGQRSRCWTKRVTWSFISVHSLHTAAVTENPLWTSSFEEEPHQCKRLYTRSKNYGLQQVRTSTFEQRQ